MEQCKDQSVCYDEKSRYAMDKKGDIHRTEAFMVSFILWVGFDHIDGFAVNQQRKVNTWWGKNQ